MYESFFSLRSRPFLPSPLAARYVPARAIEDARASLHRCLERGEGIGLVVGPAGAGKTLLLQVLAEQLRPRFEVALLNSGRLGSRRALLQAILFELGLPYRGLEESELRLSLIDHLAAPNPNAAGLLLLIDEAHTLPLRLLEEVRLISNLVRNGEPKVRLLLAGSTMLEERFASPKLESFNQRITARCYLQALDRHETNEYVRAQLAAAGTDVNRLFTHEAIEAIHRASDGIPRLINQICDHALILACANGQRRLDKLEIEEAWADLQQLPTPWNNAPGASEPPSDVIEFGVLDDDRAESLRMVPPEPPGRRGEPAMSIEFPQRVPARGKPSPETKQSPRPAALPFPAPPMQAPHSAQPHSMLPPHPMQAAASFDEDDDPVHRLLQVEEQISRLDPDFQPAGVIGGQVELDLSVSHDPFGEPFAEEEVVIDRFSSSSADALLNRPLVRCDEGQALGALLGAHVQDAALRIAPPPASAPQDSVPRHPAFDPVTIAIANESFNTSPNDSLHDSVQESIFEGGYEFPSGGPHDSPREAASLHPRLLRPEDLLIAADTNPGSSNPITGIPSPAASSEPAGVRQSISAPQRTKPVQDDSPSPLQNASFPSPQASTTQMTLAESLRIDVPQLHASSDDDLIVIEDDLPAGRDAPGREVTVVRRNEFRQLFANLRRR